MTEESNTQSTRISKDGGGKQDYSDAGLCAMTASLIFYGTLAFMIVGGFILAFR